MNECYCWMFMCFPGQDSSLLQTPNQANCAIVAAGHQASLWNTNTVLLNTDIF